MGTRGQVRPPRRQKGCGQLSAVVGEKFQRRESRHGERGRKVKHGRDDGYGAKNLLHIIKIRQLC